MKRSLRPELIDDPDFPEHEMAAVHRDLGRVHSILGTFKTIEGFVREDAVPVRKILDVGCGDGALLAHLRQRLNVDVVGIDPRPGRSRTVPMIAGDATRDELPRADVAVSSLVAHHLTPEQNVAMIRNVARSSRRFIILDLIRHPLPFGLFTMFVCPLIGKVAALDGRQSIRRAFTPKEFGEMAESALGGRGSYSIDVSPWRSRQVVDIRFVHTNT